MDPESIGIIIIEGVRLFTDVVDRASEWLHRLRTKPAAIERPVEPTYFEVLGRD